MRQYTIIHREDLCGSAVIKYKCNIFLCNVKSKKNLYSLMKIGFSIKDLASSRWGWPPRLSQILLHYDQGKRYPCRHYPIAPEIDNGQIRGGGKGGRGRYRFLTLTKYHTLSAHNAPSLLPRLESPRWSSPTKRNAQWLSAAGCIIVSSPGYLKPCVERYWR